MTKDSKIIDDLRVFLLSKAPLGVCKLPNPCFFSPESISGTNFEYLIRLRLEAREILDRGDSLVKTFAFTDDDVWSIGGAVKVLGGFLTDNTAHHDLLDKAKDLLGFSKKVSSYYIDEISLCNSERTRLDAVYQDNLQAFNNACQSADYTKLADFYPYIGGVLELPEYELLPKPVADMVERTERAEAIRLLFNNQVLNPSVVVSNLGRPNLGVNDHAFSALDRYKERNKKVWIDANQVINDFAQSLGVSAPNILDKVFSLR